jgi:release factor glutamine methyltransferase
MSPKVATPRTATALLDKAEAAIARSPHASLWNARDARLDAEELLDIARGRSGTDGRLSSGERRRFAALVDRRVAGEPMALLRGNVEFLGLRIGVRPGTFAPRMSTEALALAAIRRLRRRQRPVAVDVATGVGPVALAIANELPRAEVHGLDISARAVAVARANARELALSASFHVSDGLDSLPRRLRGRVDVITLHPPYVPCKDVSDLPREVSGYEPRHTLTDESPDGLGLVRRLAAECPDWLRPGGWLLVEVSPDRARQTRSVLVRAGLTEVSSQRPAELPVTRVVVGRV